MVSCSDLPVDLHLVAPRFALPLMQTFMLLTTYNCFTHTQAVHFIRVVRQLAVRKKTRVRNPTFLLFSFVNGIEMTIFQDQPNPSAVLLKAGELVVVSKSDNTRMIWDSCRSTCDGKVNRIAFSL